MSRMQNKQQQRQYNRSPRNKKKRSKLSIFFSDTFLEALRQVFTRLVVAVSVATFLAFITYFKTTDLYHRLEHLNQQDEAENEDDPTILKPL